MRMRHRNTRRRATALLMVVSMLALLVVIVASFLSVAQTNRDTSERITEGDRANAVVDATLAAVLPKIGAQLRDADGRVLGGQGADFSAEDSPGYRYSHYLGGLEPVWDQGVGPNPNFYPYNLPQTLDWDNLTQLRWVVSAVDGGGGSRPQMRSLYQLMIEDADDINRTFEINDAIATGRRPFNDADGDGVPDSDFLLSASLIEQGNAMVGRNVALPRFADNPLVFNFSPASLPQPGTQNNPNPDGSGLQDELWRDYGETARYDIAFRTVSHGGMIALNAPRVRNAQGQFVDPPQRSFVSDLWDSMTSEGENLELSKTSFNLDGLDADALFAQLDAQSHSVEAALRRRYVLPAPLFYDAVNNDSFRNTPPILALMEGPGGYERSLMPTFKATAAAGARDGWDGRLVNLGEVGTASENLRSGWGWTVSRPAAAVYQAQQAPQAQQPNYDLRHLTTTSSTSDELARKQSSKEPSPLQSTNPIPRFETYRGELKFYLGEIQLAFPPDGAGGYPYNGTIGRQVIHRLIPLFYDMLTSHADGGPRWGSALDDPPTTGTESVVNQREQAVMLALNAIAFAAPRDSETSITPGWIDPVVYGPVQLTADETQYTFAGYAPQPFITEVLAHNNHTLDPADEAALDGIISTFTDTTDPAQAETQLRDAFNALLPSDQPIAVAIELYNPNDPAAGAVIDPFALHNGQFGISIVGVRDTSGINSESPIYPLYSPALSEDPFGPSAARFPGRTFQTFAVTAQTNNAIFNGVASKKAMAFDFALPQPDTDKDITVRLWRRGKGLDGDPFTPDDAPPATSATPGAWHVVDQMELKLPVPTLSDVLDNDNDLNGDGGVTPDEWDITAGSDYWSSGFRDTSVARHMGDSPGDNPFLDVAEKDMFGDAAGTIGRARWGMAADLTYDTDKHYTGTLGTQTLGNASWREGGSAGVVDPDLPISPPNSPPRFGPITPLMTMNAGAAATLPIFDPAAAPETTDLRPASYPTVGFMLFTPRFAHVRILPAGMTVAEEWPMSKTLGEQWRVDRSLMSSPSGTLLRGAAKLGLYPADFGHMPIFDNTGDVKPGSYFDAVGAVPWGLLVFDYFTTINPEAPGVDPLAVSGRINVNTAPWTLLANLPLLGPVGATAATAELPIRTRGAAHVLTTGVAPLAADPAPSFWDPQVGVLVGEHTADDGVTKIPRFFGVEAVAVQNSQKGRPKAPVTGNVRWRLGNWLAQSAAAYRDGVQYLPDTGAVADYGVYADSQARGGGKYLDAGGAVSDVTAYRPTFYGTTGGVRGAPASSAATAQPTEFGFVTVGELLNVKGFDSTLPGNLPGGLAASTATTTTLGQGDFVKAVSLVALLDTQWLTTRSNTFTVYTSVIDRQAPQKSVRAQVTVDRSSILPRLEYAHLDAGGNVNQIYPLVPVTIMTGNGDRQPLRADNDYAKPRILAEQRGSYVNARFE